MTRSAMHPLRGAALLLLALVASSASAAEPSIEDLFRKSQFSGGVLSPNGRQLAIIAPVGEHLGIAVIDLETRKAVRMESPGSGDILRVVWQTDERMIGYLGDQQQIAGEGPREWGIVAVNRDGSNPRVIAGFTARRRTVSSIEEKGFLRPWTVSLVRVLSGTDEILVTAHERDLRSADLYRFDTATGAKALLSFDVPGAPSQWIVDFDNEPRVVVTRNLDDDSLAWYVRRTPGAPWTKVTEGKIGRVTSLPMQIDPDGKILYVAARREGDDRVAIYELSLDTLAFGKAIIRHPERDVGPQNAQFIVDYPGRKLLGLRYTSNRPSVVWFDPQWASMQAAVDKAFPDSVNGLQRSSANDRRWIVTTRSDTDPGEAYLLDATSMKLEKLYASRPWIDPKAAASTRWVTYKARDGLTIPAMLTEPRDRGQRRVPLIVDIHGGPNVQATAWGYDRTVQFFVSRGYAVLQPQFRGTQGFGWKLESAGYRKWGDEMQDDLEDGIAWAAEQAIIDPARVCLFGGSYGGYAAMWGAIKQAKIIRCAISLAGVTSIDYMFDNAQADNAQFVDKSSLAAELIGDPRTERARFRRVNPLDNADKVGVPILLAYGTSDRRVPIVHGTDFKAALEKHGKTFEYVAYPGEGHGLNRDENVFDFFRRVESFTAKYLGAVPR